MVERMRLACLIVVAVRRRATAVKASKSESSTRRAMRLHEALERARQHEVPVAPAAVAGGSLNAQDQVFVRDGERCRGIEAAGKQHDGV